MNRFCELMFILLVGLGILVLLVHLGGCGVLSNPGVRGVNVDEVVPVGTLGRIAEFRPSNGWISGLFLVGFVSSIIATGLGFGKLGLISAFACVLGLLLQSALTVFWLSWAIAFILSASIVLVIVGVWRKNIALKEIILGVQNLKRGRISDVVQANADLAEVQSPSTQKMVQDIKTKIKLEKK